MTGFPCFARVRRGRVRAPSIPRGQRCLHGHVCVPCPPPAALQRPVPVTPVSRPVPGCLSHEASARVHWRSPLPALPLACGPRTEREPLGFPPGFTPDWAGPSRACRGRDRPQALAWSNAVAISDLLQRTHSSRATSRRNAHTRCPLEPGPGSFRHSHHPSSEGTFLIDTPRKHPNSSGGSRLSAIPAVNLSGHPVVGKTQQFKYAGNEGAADMTRMDSAPGQKPCHRLQERWPEYPVQPGGTSPG
jgi:hypothetical protein